jgi:hypothetical protein
MPYGMQPAYGPFGLPYFNPAAPYPPFPG